MKIKTFIMGAVATMMVAVTSVAHAGEHAHFAAFFNNGSNKAFAFPDQIVGDNVEQDMMKLGAEMMIFAHSAGIKSGDVWTLANDTLREVGGEFKDFGVGCELSLKTGPFQVGGLCSVYMSSTKNKNLIKPMEIAKEVVWYKVFEDKADGVAGYFMRETGETVGH